MGSQNTYEQSYYNEQEPDDKDIIIGDANCKKKLKEAIQCFLNAGFKHLTPDYATTYVRENSSFDRFFVSGSADRNAFNYSCQ